MAFLSIFFWQNRKECPNRSKNNEDIKVFVLKQVQQYRAIKFQILKSFLGEEKCFNNPTGTEAKRKIEKRHFQFVTFLKVFLQRGISVFSKKNFL